jgi:hypothetical protein
MNPKVTGSESPVVSIMKYVEAPQTAIPKHIQKSIHNNFIEIRPFDLNERQFTVLVEKYRKDIVQSEPLISIIVGKLKSIGNATLAQEKEQRFFSQVIERFGQLFRGHGFRTRGEWTLRLAKSLENEVLDQIKNPSSSDIKKRDLINTLPMDKFKELVSSYALGLDDFEMGNFYSSLTPAYRDVFLDIVLKQKDWFETLQGLSILENVETDAVIEKFRANKAFLDAYKGSDLYVRLEDHL